MNNEKIGAAIHGSDADARREAARLMGQAKSERKTQASKENGKNGGRKPGTKLTPEHREKIAAARRTYEEVKRTTQTTTDTPDTVKRGRGRPRKEQAAQVQADI